MLFGKHYSYPELNDIMTLHLNIKRYPNFIALIMSTHGPGEMTLMMAESFYSEL